MGEIRPKTCEGRELTKDQLVPNRNSPPVPPALGCILLVALHDIIVDTAALLQVRQFYRRNIRLMEGATSFERFATSKIVRSICANRNPIPCKHVSLTRRCCCRCRRVGCPRSPRPRCSPGPRPGCAPTPPVRRRCFLDFIAKTRNRLRKLESFEEVGSNSIFQKIFLKKCLRGLEAFSQKVSGGLQGGACTRRWRRYSSSSCSLPRQSAGDNYRFPHFHFLNFWPRQSADRFPHFHFLNF